MLKLHGMGPKTLRTLQAALVQRGLAFAPAEVSGRMSEAANRKIEGRAPKRSG